MIFDNKRRRGKIALSLFILVCNIITKNTEAARDRGARCEKPDYIPNGSYRIRRDRVMRINCNSGFTLQGPRTIDCIRGKWDSEKPVCAKKGCKKDLDQPKNGRIQIENDVKAILYCSDNYNLAGNRHSYCNGSHWDRPIGNCREHKNIVQHECDFETDDICGWTYEPREGLEWKRVMAANVFTTFKTGPRHDHTTLTANGGHYMLMESLTRQNDDVTLTSPIYDRDLSLKTACCFQFYYFMYGAGVGDLFVVVKPVSLDLDEIFKTHKDLVKFQKYGNQNNIWNEAHFNIEELDEDFQILFVAKSGRGQLSDIAIDDVKLLTGTDCEALDKDEEEVSNEEYDSTTYESIFEIQSCVGHCFESPGSGIIRKSNHLKGLCNCDIDCEDNDTCCPDFRAVCINELFVQSTPIAEANEAYKSYSTMLATTTVATTKTTPKKTMTTTKSTPLTTITTTTATKPTPTTIKLTATTTKVTTSTTPATTSTTITTKRTTMTSTSPTPTATKTTKTTTLRLTTPTTTVRKTIPTTVRKTIPTTVRKTTPTTTTTRKTTLVSSTTQSTTPTTTTRKTTIKSTQKSFTTPKPTTSTIQTPTTTHVPLTTSAIVPDGTSKRKPLPTSKSIEYIINDKSKTETLNKGSSNVLLYTFFLIVVIVLAGAIYKRFGERAVAWYMIRFKPNSNDGEDSSSVSTSFKRPPAQTNGTNGKLKAAWRRKTKNYTDKNTLTTPLVEENDDDDEDDIGANGNFALKNNIYTEL